MGGFAGALRGGLAGLNDAAGNTQVAADLEAANARARQEKVNQLRLQAAPLIQSIGADQARLSTLVNPDGSPKLDQNGLPNSEYTAIENRLAQTIGQVRTLYGDKMPSDHPSRIAETIGHIRNWLKLPGKTPQEKMAAWNAQNQAEAQQYTTSALPFSLTPAGQELAAKTQSEIEVADARAKNAPEYKNVVGPNGERATIDVKTQPIPAGWTLAGTTPSVPVQPKLLEASGVPYAVSDPTTGKQYTASQMSDPSTPDNVRDIWKTAQDAITKKQQETDKREQETQERFLKAQADIAARMGQSEAFQEQMAQYREALGNYKTMDANANKTQTLADTYDAQYNDPNVKDKAAVDTALLTDYTSVLAQGGRKTQAEIALARNIGDLSLNIETTIYKRFHNGELPPKLRKMYLDYIKAAAKTQREDADKAKPDMPEVVVPQGPKTKALKQKQQGGQSLVERLSEALQ